MDFSIRSDVEPVDPSSVPFVVMEINTNQYFQVAVTTVLLFDTIITMDKEVKYFWRFPKKTVNIVYFLNRYVGLLGAVCFLFWSTYRANIPLCELKSLFAQWTRNLANYITIISIDYVLMVRVLALYCQDMRLSICLKILLLLEAILKFIAFIFVTKLDDVAIAGLAEDATACGVDGVPQMKWAILDWVIPMAYGFILMILAIYKGAAFWKVSAGLKGFPLVKVLIQDQLIILPLLLSVAP